MSKYIANDLEVSSDEENYSEENSPWYDNVFFERVILTMQCLFVEHFW